MRKLIDILNEAKVDDEYEKNYSSFMPRKIFDDILIIDPKTTVVNGQPQGLGFVAKNLLLPAYIAGETDFIDNREEIKEIISKYYDGIANYPKPKDFKTLADFLIFMQNPENNNIEIVKKEKENPIDSIYNKYWTKIPREEFDEIIKLDPQTSETKIGELARNFLLPKYSAGERWILENSLTKEEVKSAISRFIEEKSSFEKDRQNINNYSSIREFVDYKPKSVILAEVPHIQEGEDFIYIASTPTYDVFKPLTFQGSRDLAHTHNSKNVWCTAGGAEGNYYANEDGMSTYWISYRDPYNRNCELYEFINKINPTILEDNYNLALQRGSGKTYEFRNGKNQNSDDSIKTFLAFLIKNPDLTFKLKKSSDPLLRNNPEINKAVTLIQLQSEPIHIKNDIDQVKFLRESDDIRTVVKEAVIENIDEIIPQLFYSCKGLTTVKIKGVKVIGIEAFKQCENLTKLILDEPLETIEAEAFANCTNLRGSIRLPNTLTSIQEKAFYGTHCTLKIDRDRTTKIKFDSRDKDWVTSHIESIKIR